MGNLGCYGDHRYGDSFDCSHEIADEPAGKGKEINAELKMFLLDLEGKYERNDERIWRRRTV